MPQITETGQAVLAIVIGFTLVALLLYFLKDWAISSRKLRDSREHEERMKKAEDVLRERGVRFIANENHKVSGLCSKGAFDASMAVHLVLVGQGAISPWEKVSLRVKPTYTFSVDGGDVRPIHTGTRQMGEDVIRRYICRVTGLDPSDLDNKTSFNRLADLVVKTDSRLYVPYCAGSDGAADHKFFGVTTMEQFGMSASLDPGVWSVD